MGMFDRLHVSCPNCGSSNELQSKYGPCILEDYTLNTAPLLVLADLNRDDIYCQHCSTQIHVRVNFSASIECVDANRTTQIRSV